MNNDFDLRSLSSW